MRDEGVKEVDVVYQTQYQGVLSTSVPATFPTSLHCTSFVFFNPPSSFLSFFEPPDP